MKNCTSMFAQVLHIVNRKVFERVVQQHQGNARSKSFPS